MDFHNMRQQNDYDDKTICAKCGQVVEETLMLTCDHNLCLPCAAKNLSREESKGIHKFQTVVCDVCNAPTTIDPNTSQELMSLTPSENLSRVRSKVDLDNNNYSKKYQTNESLNVSSVSRTYNSPTYNNNQVNNNGNLLSASFTNNFANLLNNNPSARREVCREHSEEVSYFCLDCSTKCICSECVVHGVHKTHDVLHIKKAYPLISEKMNGLLSHVKDKIDEFNMFQSTIDLKKKDIVETTNSVKQQMASAFEEIRLRLMKKEKELMEKADDFLAEHLQELNTYTRVVQSNIITFSKVIDTINSNVLRRDEVNLLNFYAENQNKILQMSTNTNTPDLPDFNTISSLKVNINKESIESLVNCLNGIQIEITNVKGFEVAKTNNSFKYSVKRDMYGSGNIKNTNITSNQVNTMNNTNNNPNLDYLRNNTNLNNSFKSIGNSIGNSMFDEFNSKKKSYQNY